MKQLFGVSLLHRIDRIKHIKEAWSLYNEFDEIKGDKHVGEEYELVRLWAEDLKVDRFFEMIEDDLAEDQQLKAIEDDPFNLEGDRAEEDEEMTKFIGSHKRDDVNMAVVFYIIDAISHFKGKSIDKIKEITFEIAMIGRTGIDPRKEDKYSLSTVPNQSFTGWRMLAWMFTRFMEFEPNLAEHLKLDFSEEYEMAVKLAVGE